MALSGLVVVAGDLLPGVGPGPAAAAGEPACGVPSDMLGKGLDAWKANRYEIALPAFDCVLRNDNGLQRFFAEFYTARILSDDAGGFVDHAKAYTLFQSLADTIDTVDPEDRRAPFVAKAVTAVAGYVRKGLPEIGLKPDAERAVELIRQSATFFNEPDAQFELAKLHLTGKGVPLDVRLGLHYIQKLVQDSHAGAQAYLADLHWNGKYVPLDHVRALALMKLATENTTPSDRLWIEDSYQIFYCGTPSSERSKAADLTGQFRRTFARGQIADRGSSALPPGWGLGGRRDLGLARTCSNGEKIDMDLKGALQRDPLAATPVANSIAQPGPQPTMPAGVRSAPVR